ncbi:dynein intermediate chain 1, axonemal-like [Diaphorina citri]|uniref:Dynein intermediate chain 1, axonemal-like n=1 Tax=Diaphorina citri TaxID=121845 RepID=A0A3Q0IJ00_DIACI|nr:dynein intermediate chain 1, axonemal-like [Diaphorina citri]
MPLPNLKLLKPPLSVKQKSKSSLKKEKGESEEKLEYTCKKSSICRPPDQLDLTDKELEEECVKTLTTINPQLSDSLVEFNFKNNEYELLNELSHRIDVINVEGHLLHKESAEAKKQLNIEDEEGERKTGVFIWSENFCLDRTLNSVTAGCHCGDIPNSYLLKLTSPNQSGSWKSQQHMIAQTVTSSDTDHAQNSGKEERRASIEQQEVKPKEKKKKKSIEKSVDESEEVDESTNQKKSVDESEEVDESVEDEQTGEDEQDKSEEEEEEKDEDGKEEDDKECVEEEEEEVEQEQVEEDKGKKGGKTKKLMNQFNFCERGSLTYNNPYREVTTQTIPPPRASYNDYVTQWIIYDAYCEDYENHVKEREKDKQAKVTVLKNPLLTSKKKQPKGFLEPSVSKMLQAAKVLERMCNQNTFDEIAQDFRYYEDISDEFRDGEGTLLPLWKFSYENTKKYQVTFLQWHPHYYDLFGISFGSFDFLKKCAEGYLCLFSLKNPSYPEYINHVKSGVMCFDFHHTHSSFLAVGLYDGGYLTTLKLSPNCRIKPKPPKKQQHLDPYILEVQKLDKLLSLVREPSAIAKQEEESSVSS